MIDQRELFGFTLLPSCRASATQPCALLHSAIRPGFKRAVSSPCRSLRVVVIVMGGGTVGAILLCLCGADSSPSSHQLDLLE